MIKSLFYDLASIRMLRAEAPSWNWRVTRQGFAGREYTGERDGEEVRVVLTATLWDDEGLTPGVWLVYPGGRSLFEWLRENGRPRLEEVAS